MIYEPMVCLAQILHLSCVKIRTISKRTKTSFNSSLVTKEYNPVCLKWFLSLWYTWHKLWTCLALILTLSLNRPKQDSAWPTSLGVPSGAFKMICKPMLRSVQTVRLSCTNTNTIFKWTKRGSTWPTSHKSSIGCVQKDFQAYGMFGANHAPILHQL
jgi:hypothetical protein